MTPLIRNIFFAIGALAILTGVVVGAYWIRGAATDRPRSAVEASQDVLVAAKAIPVGTLLREEDLAWRSAPGVKRPQGSFRQATTSKAELVGAVARRSFTEGEILTGAGILRPTDRGFLAATLNPGFRAVTLPIEAAQSASGLVLPGDHVDVILVQEFDGGSRSRSSVGEVILRNARIVAVGRTFEATINTSPTASTPAVQRTANTSAAAPRTITLEVSSVDAERLFVATQLGKLQLALHALVQPEAVPAEADGPRLVWAGDVSSALGPADVRRPTTGAPQARSQPRPVAQAEPVPSVRILRGSKTEIQ